LREVVGPSLPFTALIALVLFAASWQEFLWPLIAIVNPQNSTLAVALFFMAQSFRGVMDLLPAGVALLVWPVALALLVVLGGLMVWAGRLRIVRAP
jgi:multiple sugar transport system permease protein